MPFESDARAAEAAVADLIDSIDTLSVPALLALRDRIDRALAEPALNPSDVTALVTAPDVQKEST